MKIISANHNYVSKNEIGGKAYNLFRLKEWGFHVPDFVVIPSSELTNVISNKINLNWEFDDVKKAIREYQINETTLKEILSYFNTKNRFFAVRSSATDEDGNDFSFAGQFETCLFVTADTLANSIKKIWLSAFSEKVMTYRKENGLASHSGIAVIIQEMVIT